MAMPGSEPLDPKPTDDPARTGPETAPEPGAASEGPLPSPSRSGTPDGPLTLETDLLGPLTLPDGAARTGRAFAPCGAVYATRARGDGTRLAYRTRLAEYEAWCRSLGCEPLGADPDTIAMHVVRLADAGSRSARSASRLPRS